MQKVNVPTQAHVSSTQCDRYINLLQQSLILSCVGYDSSEGLSPVLETISDSIDEEDEDKVTVADSRAMKHALLRITPLNTNKTQRER